MPLSVQALKEAGCEEVVLAINYRPQVGWLVAALAWVG